jgi:Porin subfamily
MRPVKRVLLGSAAGIFAVAGAQAADLPVKAKPVEFVKACTLYGIGYWYVPGTDTCIKVGAYTKLQAEYNTTNGPFMIGVANNGAADNGGRFTRTDTSPFTWNQRGVISFDMRTQTEYGTLRSYIDVGEQTQASDVGGSANLLAASTLYNSRAFIQFAGFTAGRMRSFFDMYYQGAYSFTSSRFGNDTSPNGIIGIAYTWQFGGGLSANFSLEDNSQGAGARGRSTINASQPGTLAIGTETTNLKGVEFFDPVFNLRLEQTWGFVGVSAALHDASGGYYQQPGLNGGALLEGNGHPGDKFGWAVSPAFLVNSPLGLQGDTIAAQGVYSVGAAGFATPIFGPTTIFGSGANLGLGWLAEGVFTTGSNVELTTVWSFNGTYEHRWDPKWRTSVYGGMLGVQYDDSAKQAICANLATTITTARANCDPNFSLSQVGTRTLWNPVPDLDVGVDLTWYHLNTAFGGGIANIAAPQGAKPAGNYAISNQDALSAIFRIQRNFLY